MTREEAIKIFNTVLLFGKCDCSKEECEECFKMAIKALEQEPKIKVLDHDEVARKLGTVDIYKASVWITLLKDLECLGMKICEVKE